MSTYFISDTNTVNMLSIEIQKKPSCNIIIYVNERCMVYGDGINDKKMFIASRGCGSLL